MSRLSPEQTEYATTLLINLIHIRELNQGQLREMSGISQPQLSLITSRKRPPTKEQLETLFQALGILLRDVIAEAEDVPEFVYGYFATPLTSFVNEAKHDENLRSFVQQVKDVAASLRTAKPHLRLYWPGDFTHPLKNAAYSPQQVYITDRSRAGTYHFMISLCANRSYGVGQENEIATQGCVAGIRFVQDGLTRMMTGSFLNTTDIRFFGTAETGFTFDKNELLDGLKNVRQLYFRHRALFRRINDADFAVRLQRLIDDRMVQDRTQFAQDVGISMDYLLALLNEPFNVSNPSATILKRIAAVLGVTVGYLLGESADSDPILAASMAGGHKWVTSTSGIEARDAMELKELWTENYLRKRHGEFLTGLHNRKSKRNAQQSHLRAMTEEDWDNLYRAGDSKRASNMRLTSESFADPKPAVSVLPAKRDHGPKRALAATPRSRNH